MKDTAGVSVELKQIYSFGFHSHHRNGAPRPAKSKPNYRSERPDPPFLPPPKQKAEGEGTNTNTGGDRTEKDRLLDCLSGG
jgi:hypothetical protein